MIKIEQTEVSGFAAAIRGMRNPMNSWDKMDSHVCNCDEYDSDCPMVANGDEPGEECNDGKWKLVHCHIKFIGAALADIINLFICLAFGFTNRHIKNFFGQAVLGRDTRLHTHTP